MAVTTPDWLKQHDADLKPSKDGHSWTVYFAGELQYLLLPVPARGRFSCRISQTINGKRLDSGQTWETPEQTVQGGLEELRKALGW